MDIVQIFADSHELEAFEEEERRITENEEHADRPTWPTTGMKCQVPGCKTETFTKYGKYLDHWLFTHRMFVALHECSVCLRNFKKKNVGDHHMRVYHKNGGEMKRVRIWNHKFIHPRDYVLPKPPPPTSGRCVKYRDNDDRRRYRDNDDRKRYRDNDCRRK